MFNPDYSQYVQRNGHNLNWPSGAPQGIAPWPSYPHQNPWQTAHPQVPAPQMQQFQPNQNHPLAERFRITVIQGSYEVLDLSVREISSYIKRLKERQAIEDYDESMPQAITQLQKLREMLVNPRMLITGNVMHTPLLLWVDILPVLTKHRIIPEHRFYRLRLSSPGSAMFNEALQAGLIMPVGHPAIPQRITGFPISVMGKSFWADFAQELSRSPYVITAVHVNQTIREIMRALIDQPAQIEDTIRDQITLALRTYQIPHQI